MRTAQPDAIVLDLIMPVMAGWEFLERCRNDPLCGGYRLPPADQRAGMPVRPPR